MAFSGKGTKEELEQRRRAALKHGAYAFRDHGDQALDVTGRSRMAELSEIVQTKPGVLSLLQERAVRAVMLCEILEAFVIEQQQSGKSLETILVLGKLPAFQNSAQRYIQSLLHELHDDSNVLDAGKVLEAIKNGANDETG